MNDCGCGGGSDCITLNKKDFKKWVKAELKRLDCGCGCKGVNKFEEKYGKLVGGKLKDCPPGWRNDGLTCVKNCEPGEKDDGLTCRKPCPAGFVDDGLTCRKPITSSMNDCPPGSKDIWGTCWGPVRKDCVDDCFKHPAPGCKTNQCGRLEWAGIDWGPKLCTSCNLRCGQTCWDVQGITKQLHERELKITGGEVEGKSIYSKEIRGRIDFEETNREIEQSFINAFGNDSELAKAFDPEKNGVADSFRKFGVNTKEAFDDIGRKIKEGFEKALTPEFKNWLKVKERGWKRAFKVIFPPEVIEAMNEPEFWIQVAIIVAEASAVLLATAAAGTVAGAPFAGAILMAGNMFGPALRMIIKASRGETIDAFDISSLVLAAIPPPGKNAVAAATYFGKVADFFRRNKSAIEKAHNILLAGVRFGQMIGRIPSSCIANCPEIDNRPFPPPDNKNPVYIPPQNPPPPGQKTDAELMAMAPGNKPFTKFLTDGPEVNPDYVGTPIKWIKKKRRELYNYPAAETTTGDAGNLESKEDEKIDDLTKVDEDKTQQNIESEIPENLEELYGLGRGGAFDGELIEPVKIGNTYVNPGGELEFNPSDSNVEIPKGPGGCEFNVRCYAQNYPDLYNALGKNDALMTAYWRDVGKESGENPCCGAKLEMGKNYDEAHMRCNARNGFYDRKTTTCDTMRNSKGIKKNRMQFAEDNCKAKGNFWDKGYEIYVTEEKTQPDFFTGKYEIRRTERTRPTGNPNCDPTRNLAGKIKIEEAAKQQAEANKRTLDRIVKEDFFPACYAANNPDVVAKVGNTDAALETHFREFGVNEQRSSKCDATLQEQKVAANKAKALEGFNAYCYAYNNPEVFKEVSASYFATPGQRPHPDVLTQQLRQHFMDVGYAKKLDYSCGPRDSEYNWRCFSENMRTVVAPGQLNFDNEGLVNRYWETQKNNSWETFNKGSCLDKDLRKSQQTRDFNAKCYGFNNPELIARFGRDDAAYLNHFRNEGFEQGLDPTCDLRNQTFKPECYGFANPDLGTSDVTALTNHWNSNGKNEWRSINCTAEQAETVFQKQYCQDTESFWDGTNCDLTRHTNGQSKAELSQKVLDDYINLFPEAQREDKRKEVEHRNFNDQWNIDLTENREACNRKNGRLDDVNSGDQNTKILGDEVFTCNLNFTPEGKSKKELCNQQNEYYDEVTRLCDASRIPSGLTEAQEEERIKLEEERIKLDEEANLKRELCHLQNQYYDEVSRVCDPLRIPNGRTLIEIKEEEEKRLELIRLEDERQRLERLRLEEEERIKLEEELKRAKPYNDTITYNVGDVIEYNGIIYRMIFSSGEPGTTPGPNAGNFQQIGRVSEEELKKREDELKEKLRLDEEEKILNAKLYDNSETYQVGDFVKYKGIIYKMIIGIGADGYTPESHPNNWQVMSTPEQIEKAKEEKILNAKLYDNSETYNVGDFVKYKGIIYKMIIGIGADGYTPESHPNNWQVMSTPEQIEKTKEDEIKSGIKSVGEYNDAEIYNVGNIVIFDGITYKMIQFFGNNGEIPRKNSLYWEELYSSPEQIQKAKEEDEQKAKSAEMYSWNKSYKFGDFVNFEGIVYKLMRGFDGTTPPNSNYWKEIKITPVETKPVEPAPAAVEDYNNGKTYQVGDVVAYNGKVYKMIAFIGAAGYNPAGFPGNWEPVPTGSGKPSLTLYWAEWCPHCHDLLPIWKKLKHKGVQIQAIEESDSDFQVDSYPTIIFQSGNMMEKYEGPRTAKAIKNALKNKLS